MDIIRTCIRILFLGIIIALIIPTGLSTETRGEDNGSSINGTVYAPALESPSPIVFFYDDDCESCIRVKPYIDSMKSAYPEVDFTYRNICGEVAEGKENLELFEKFKKERDLTGVYVPVVFFGDITLHGEQNITRDLEEKIQTTLGLSSAADRVARPVSTQKAAPMTIDSEAVEFFYDEHNQPSLNIMPYIDSLQAAYPTIRFLYHNVCGKSPENLQNSTLLDSFIRESGISEGNIPLVTYQGTYLIGDVNISRDLQSLIEKKPGLRSNSPGISPPVTPPGASIVPGGSNGVHFFFDEHCEPCQKVMPYMNTLQTRYPDIRFTYYNICGKSPENLQNRSTFDDLIHQKGLINASVPLVLIGETIIEGDDILTEAEPFLQRTASSPSTGDGSSLLDQIISAIRSFFP